LVYFGIGTLLFFLVLSVLFFRLLSHTLPPAELAPTNFIMLAPIGILIVDLFQISNAADIILGTNLKALAVLTGSALWGFGLWALLVNVLLLIKYSRLKFPFHMGWWSFVFPTAAFTLGTLSLSKSLQPFQPVSDILYVFLIAIWAIISVRTLMLWLSSAFKKDSSIVNPMGRNNQTE
jgi:C4-dicarboxylate transporter/malic acid transport protein